jgi:hypothetical protein
MKENMHTEKERQTEKDRQRDTQRRDFLGEVSTVQ